MSKVSKILFLCAGLFLISAYVIYVMAGWLNLNTVFVVIAVGLIVLSVVLDWKLYWEFLTLRTTKHGMNMGLMVLLMVTAVVCVNYLGNKHNKTWDLTLEKVNSLSDQTKQVLGSLSDDVEVKVFYRFDSRRSEKNQRGDVEQLKSRIRNQVGLLNDFSNKIKLTFINAFVDEAAVVQDLADQPDRRDFSIIALLINKGKKIRLDEPFDEATFTSALIKATRTGDSKIYFVRGHGEKEITSGSALGLSEMAHALEEASFKVESLDLAERKEVPADASVVAIVGPSIPFLDSELKWLNEYAQRGGRLFVAVDPGERHNLANLVKPLGAEFANNFVLNTRMQVVGGGATTALGRTFDPKSDITKSLPGGTNIILPLASEVKPAPGAGGTIEAVEIVKVDPQSFTVNDLSNPPDSKPVNRAVTVGVSTKGTIADAPANKPFEAVIFGDSDFVSNGFLMAGANRDLALNAIADLANQKDLLSIRPKTARATVMTLTGMQKLIIVICGLSVPVFLLISSGVMWFRRRGA